MTPGKFELRQELRQLLAPEMLQLLKLLQLPTLELQLLVRQELELNPLLDEETEEEPPETDGTYESQAERPEPEPEPKIDWDDFMQQGYDDGYRFPTEKSEETEGPPIISRESFQEYLLSQLRMACTDHGDLALGEQIIGNLGDDGYLRVSLEEISQQRGAPLDLLERVLLLVQTFDPPGVGARNLRECLQIQLVQKGLEDSLAYRIVTGHLEDLEHQRYPAIARALKASEREVLQARAVIAGLSPKPGISHDTEEIRYIFPDIIVDRVDGEYVAMINDRSIPRVRVTAGYRQMLSQTRKSSPKDHEYIVKRLEAARFIVRMIEQRRRTLSKIMSFIIERQRGFLDGGLKGLRPMTMSQIADDVGIHESTVSRAVQNKYVLTPHGVIALRYLFGGGLKSEAGMDSAKGIRAKIVEMIAQEDGKQVLTDQVIASRLAADGITIARRTVAKYREEEKILPAKLRRKR